MHRGIIALVAFFAGWAATAHAQGVTGTTAAGKHVRVPDGEEVPWKDDVVHWVPPHYPNRDRYIGNHGTGRFRLVFDPKTGAVARVEKLRSTGYASLDQAATSALEQWRVRPQTWRTFDMVVSYRWWPTRAGAMSEIHRLEAEQKKRKAAANAAKH